MKKHLPLLKCLQESSPERRHNIVRHSDLDLIRTINECVYNSLKGNIPLKKSEISKLKQFKKILRKIFQSSGGLEKKRKIIIQSGGAFLPALLSPIVTAAENHFTSREQKRKKWLQKNQSHLIWILKSKTIFTWSFAHRLARQGKWHIAAIDRMRFQRRIEQTQNILDPVLLRHISKTI